MRSVVRALGVLGLLGAGVASACSSASSGGGGGASGLGGATGGGGSGGVGLAGSGGLLSGGSGGGGGLNPDASCAKFSQEAKQASAALLFVVDGTASMAQSQKWGTAQIATITAIDKDSFDNTSLGLLRFPGSFTDPPKCLCDYACAPLGGCDIATCKVLAFPGGIACGVSFLPQVQIADSGTQKSNQGGVRKGMYDYLANPQNGPVNDPSDASPIYDSLNAGYTSLAAQNIDRRVLILITDGGFSCTSVANPTRPGYSDGACNDWEYPDSVNALIKGKHDDPQKPVNTFIIGVPGSDSTGQKQGTYATAPYNMLLALSTYAVSGSPETIPTDCDKSLTFSQTGAAPAKPCHFDLSKNTFNADQLSTAIETIRGKALGCLFDIPTPPPGEVVDKNKTNVNLTLEGKTETIPKRSDPNDTCATSPCWDFKGDKQIELIGKACEDLSKAKQAKVEIFSGCTQIVK